MATPDRRSGRTLPAGAAALTLACLQAQGPAQEAAAPATDWPAVVRQSQEHRRVMVRRAAANKVAAAGDAAIAAVRGFEKEHGRNAIGIELVTAYGLSDHGGEATLALLEAWVADRDFYWRSQALAALAHRRLPRHRPLFEAHLTDPSHLARIQAGRGLCRLGVAKDRVLALLRDPHPAVRVRVAICLLEQKDDRGLPVLVEALRQEGAFFDYPWGRLGAQEAFNALRKVTGDPLGYRVGESAEANREAIGRFETFARNRLGEAFVPPVPAHRDAAGYLGGVAIRSCRNGDLFVRLKDDRRVVFGLEARDSTVLSEAAQRAVLDALPGPGEGIAGQVVCDYLRTMWTNPTADRKFAPGHLDPESGKWLEALAAALEKNGRPDLAGQLRTRLGQFERPR